MKKFAIVAMGLCLILASSVVAQDASVKGKMIASGYLGYSLGMGDAFDEIETPGMKASLDAGLAFGGAFHYGLTDKIFFGGEVMFQNYKAEVEFTDPILASASASDSEMKFNIMGSMLYAMNYTDEQALFLSAGLGMYDSEIGFNGGVVWRKMVSPTIGLFVSPRIHIIMADDMFELIQLTAGVQIPLGAN